MIGEPTHTTLKQRNGTACPSYIDYHLKSEGTQETLLPAMFNPFYSSTNQQMFLKEPLQSK